MQAHNIRHDSSVPCQTAPCRPFLMIALVMAGFLTAMQVWADERSLETADLIDYTKIRDIRLSPDGGSLIIMTRTADLEDNRDVDRVVWQPAPPGMQPEALAELLQIRSPRWRPGSEEVGFIAQDEGPAQVWLVAPPDGIPQPLTDHDRPIRTFDWSPDARHIAFTSPAATGSAAKPDRDKQRGRIIDKETFRIGRLLGDAPMDRQARSTELWIHDTRSGASRHIDTAGAIKNPAWSPDGTKLAYIARPSEHFAHPRADLKVHSLDDDSERTLATGSGSLFDWDGAIAYSKPFWSPQGKRLGFIRQDRSDRWSAARSIGYYDFDNDTEIIVATPTEPELYGAVPHWRQTGRIDFEITRNARRGLYSFSLAQDRFEPVITPSGHAARFRLAENADTIAWVEEAVDRPPEVMIAHGAGDEPRPVTAFNRAHKDLQLPEGEWTEWESLDGTSVEGLLVRPDDGEHKAPHPLLVIVHGGPGLAARNGFDVYHSWPYPTQAFAEQGYAVFYPNYRGTGSYGKTFREPESLDGEPVDDIVTGIDHLVTQGIADQDRIGMLGQSHGGWLGPMATIEHGDIRAASFAEGWVNWTSLYGHMPGLLNRNIHEYYIGASPYEDPERYHDRSPIFLLEDLDTPMMLEFGETSAAPQGLEFASALWRNDIPYELVIYPDTGHNIDRPRQRLESANRNLDWFNFWMGHASVDDLIEPRRHRRWSDLRND